MAHIKSQKARLLARIRRLQGQLAGLHRAIDEERDCSEILHTLSAFRGAANGLLLEVLEGHIRHHIIDDGTGDVHEDPAEAAEELIRVLKTYLK